MSHYLYRIALVVLAFGAAVLLANADHCYLAGLAAVAGVWRTVRA